MDDLVRQAMAKWPNVPDCYGWLGLDSRGQWYMRDDRVQGLGSFQSGVPGAKGSVLRHDKLIDFICRNYEADAKGRWYFQNGPQRVYVELEATPLVWRLDAQGHAQAHSGRTGQVQRAWVAEECWLFLETEVGFGLLHTLDVGLAAECLDRELWPLHECRRADLPQRFAYVRSPQQTAPRA